MAVKQETRRQPSGLTPGKKAVSAASMPVVAQVQKRTLKQKLLRGGLIVFLGLCLLLLFAGGVFYGLTSMKIIDPEEQAQKMGWQDNVVVKAAIDKLKTPQQAEIVVKPDKDEPATVQPQPGILGGTTQPYGMTGASAMPPVVQVAPIDTKERDRLEKVRQQEEKKRVSKLARLYEGMKPSEAVSIMEQLDDDTIVAVLNRMEEDNAAKVLAGFDSSRAASLSAAMLRNRPNQTFIPQQN